MPATNFTRSKWYNLVLRNTAWTAPANLYVEWCNDNTVPDAATAGTASGAGRTLLTMADDGGDGAGVSSAQVATTAMPAETYPYLEIWDASSSGNRLAWCAVSSALIFSFSGVAYIDAGALLGTIAGGASDYLRNALYDHLFRATTFTPPATVYMELCTSATVPTSASAGTASGAGRIATTFGADTNGTGANSNAPSFTPLTSLTIRYVELWDASSSGNRLHWGQVSDVTVGSGSNTVTVTAGNLTMVYT